MEEIQDMQFGSHDLIDDDIGISRHCKLSRAGDGAGASDIWERAKKPDRLAQRGDDAFAAIGFSRPMCS